MASCSSRTVDVQVALQKAKQKVDHLRRLVHKQTSSEQEQSSSSPWNPSKELRESLVNMYKANPRVNDELRQRLPSPERSGFSPDLGHWPLAPQNLQDPPLSALSSWRSVSPVSPPFRRRSVSVSPLVSRPPGGAGDMEVDLSSSRGASPWAEGWTDHPDGGGASRGPASPAPKRHLVATEESCRPEASSAPVVASGRIQSLDRDKNISFLLKELDALRDLNNKLQEQLLQKEKELKRREAEEELRVEQEEAQSWEKPAAVLEELLDAQKNRDHALMSRLLLANEERDEALLRARRLQQAAAHELDPITLEDADTDVEELLRCICDADSVQEVEQFGPILVQYLRLARQRRSDITAQEMKAVMEERDSTVAKCKHVEEDLIQEREQRTSKDELLRLQRERDQAVDERCRLEAELQAIRPSHRSQDATPPCQPLLLGDETPPLVAQLQQLSKEKQSVEAELQRCQEAEREASERVRRLERLVEVLRKKVGTGSVRAVM